MLSTNQKVRILYLVVCCCLSSSILIGQSDAEKEFKERVEATTLDNGSYFEYLLRYSEFLSRRNAPNALSTTNKLIDQSFDNKKWDYWIKGNILKASLLDFKKDTIQGTTSFESIFNHSEVQKDSSLIGLALHYKASVVLTAYDRHSDSTLTEAYKAAKTAVHLLHDKHPAESANARLDIANYFLLTGKQAEGLNKAEQTLALSRKTNNNLVIGRNLYLIAYASRYMSKNKRAVETALEALNYLEKDSDYRHLSGVYRVLTELAIAENNKDKTLEYSKLAFDYSLLTNNPRSVANAYMSTIQALLQVRGHLDEADSLNQEYLKLSNEYDFEHGRVYHYLLKGWIYQEKDSTQVAIEAYIKSLELSELATITNVKPWLLKSLTNLMREDNIPSEWTSEKVLAYYKSRDLTQESDLNVAIICNALKNLYTQEGDIEKAFDFSEKELYHKEKAWCQRSNTDLESQRLKLDNQAKESELIFERAQNKQQKVNQRLLILLAGSIFIFGLISSYFLAKQRRTNKKIQNQNQKLEENESKIIQLINEVEEKNLLLKERLVLKQKELIDYTVFREKRNREIISISKIMDSLIKKGNANVLDLTTLKEKQERLAINSDEYELKQRIESLYPGFFEKLELNHPKLTKGDVRHCAYILIGLSIKQVAELLFIAPKTVESARYRAKQKMQLSNDVRLKDYLLQIQNG